MAVELDEQERREVELKARAAVLGAIRGLGGEGTRREILDRALTGGGFTSRELEAAAPESAGPKHSTYVQYRLSWTLTNLKGAGVLENPRRSVWRLSGAPACDLSEPQDPVSPERIAELQAMPYREYLRTPEWRRTRAAALERAGHRCSLDQMHSDNVEVHHNTYDRLGAELPSDVVVLCRACHRLHHRTYGRPRRGRVASRTPTALAADLVEPATGTQSAPQLPQRDASPSGKRPLWRRILTGA